MKLEFQPEAEAGLFPISLVKFPVLRFPTSAMRFAKMLFLHRVGYNVFGLTTV